MSFLLILSILAFMSGCTQKVRARTASMSRISQESIKPVPYGEKEMQNYDQKIKGLSEKRVDYSKKEIDRMRLRFLLTMLQSLENMVSSAGIPVVCPSINFSIDRTIRAYYTLERLNKAMERNIGVSLEVNESKVELEHVRSF
ncbi:MAG: hypothetical protein HQL31_09905 [Planctomycetes bacterium]|nr:hypothetical protein [Planctomycetota bacterium]